MDPDVIIIISTLPGVVDARRASGDSMPCRCSGRSGTRRLTQHLQPCDRRSAAQRQAPTQFLRRTQRPQEEPKVNLLLRFEGRPTNVPPLPSRGTFRCIVWLSPAVLTHANLAQADFTGAVAVQATLRSPSSLSSSLAPSPLCNDWSYDRLDGPSAIRNPSLWARTSSSECLVSSSRNQEVRNGKTVAASARLAPSCLAVAWRRVHSRVQLCDECVREGQSMAAGVVVAQRDGRRDVTA